MGSIQSSVNQAIGSVGSSIAIGSHLAAQNKELEVKKIEAEKEFKNAELAVAQNDLELQGEILKNPRLDESGKPITDKDEYLKTRMGEEIEKVGKAASEYNERYWKNPEVQHGSKRLDKAQESLLELSDEINARRNLKFDLDIAKKKFKSLGGEA